MLLEDAKYQKYSGKDLEDLSYSSKEITFCKRSGVKGFLSKEHFEKINNTYGPKTLEIVSSDLVKKIDVRSSPCIRIFFSKLSGFKIPQLSLYSPESGFPLCNPDKTSSFFRGGAWPSKVSRQLVTIPVAHILEGLVSGLTESCHNYTVFFGNEEERFYPSNLNPGSLYPENKVPYGKIFSFITDKNYVDNFKEISSEFWPEFDIAPLLASSSLPPEVETLISDTGYGQQLTDEEFNSYLPYWAWMYPHKYRRARGDSSGSTGSLDINQGFIPYSFDGKRDLMGEGSRLYKEYYSLNKGICFKTMNYHFKSVEKLHSFYNSVNDSLKNVFHQKFNTLPENFILECLRIRGFIDSLESSIRKKNYFSFSKFPRRDLPYTQLSNASLNLFSKVIDHRERLSKGSKTVSIDGKACSKCSEDLLVPKILAELNPPTRDMVCIKCGFKYLVNLINFSLEEDWLYFENYDLSEILSKNSLKEIGTALIDLKKKENTHVSPSLTVT